MASAAVKTRVYVIGGYDGQSRLRTVECLDLSEVTPAWQTVSEMHHRRGLAGVCVHQGKNWTILTDSFHVCNVCATSESWYRFIKVKFDYNKGKCQTGNRWNTGLLLIAEVLY